METWLSVGRMEGWNLEGANEVVKDGRGSKERHGSCEERRRAGEESKKREGMFQVRVKEVRKGEKDQ